MQKHEVHDKPVTDASSTPQWAQPPPPGPRGREWLVVIFERFGFLMAIVLTIGILIVLFINSEMLLSKPDTDSRQGTGTARQQSASASESAPLSITTQPSNAAVFVDGEFVGVSPLRELALSTGVHRLSIQKQDYAAIDTVVTLASDPAMLRLTLRATDQAVLVDESHDQPPPERTAAETNPHTPASLEQPASPEPASAEEQPAIIPQAAPADQATTPPDHTDQADVDQTGTSALEGEAAMPEVSVVEVGELQVRSQPSGAAVWLANEQVGITPVLVTDVEAGAQQVTLRLDGYEPFTTTVDVAPQQRSEVNGQLTQRLGTLKILAKPWGNIYIDGKLHKSEANIWYTAKLSPGNHQVRVEHPSLGKWEQVVVVTLEEEGKVEVDFNKGKSSSQ